MGIKVHGNKEVDSQKHLKRFHKIVSWIESPLQGADKDSLVFHQRHEANTVELFFDLFFVANLATFTAYHSITDLNSLFAYIGFFSILWSSWFQIVLHDVRFARDSAYERACKTIQFIVFVGLALVGSSFDPGGEKANNTNFRILCYVLFISRVLLTFQYIIVLIFTMKAGYKKLYFPLILNIVIYATAAVVFAAMTPAFRNYALNHQGIYIVWYIVMLIEAFGVITISCIWRMLSFKKTHLVERMGLLTLIVIGEGAIGVTKTISRMMGKYGLDTEACFLVICIILVLIFLWCLYFDNSPHGHYGTIRQQIWSVLHFPLQLTIVGVVEGSQQVALARYIMRQTTKIDKAFYEDCMVNHLDGVPLVNAIVKSLQYFQLESKVESERWIPVLNDDIFTIGNMTSICAPENVNGKYEPGWYPQELVNLLYDSLGAIYSSLGMKLPLDKDPTLVAVHSWRIVYIYYWSSFVLLLASLIAFLFLIRKNKADIFDWVSVIVRFVVLLAGAALIAVAANQDALFTFLATPAVLPTCVILLFLVLLFDRLSGVFANWRLRKSGQAFVREEDEDHEHEAHGEHHTTLDKNGVEVGTSETDPLTANTAYMGVQSFAMGPVSVHKSPPPSFRSSASGYMPVGNDQLYGV